MEYVPCIGNSSYSFWRILLKLYRCFKDGLKICILFFQNPEIIFYHFLRIFNLDIFRALILQICIWSMYLVSATPPTVFGESFWNFTDVLRMVCKVSKCVFFGPKKMRFMQTESVLQTKNRSEPAKNRFSLSPDSGDMHIVFSESWNYFLSLFSHF